MNVPERLEEARSAAIGELKTATDYYMTTLKQRWTSRDCHYREFLTAEAHERIWQRVTTIMNRNGGDIVDAVRQAREYYLSQITAPGAESVPSGPDALYAAEQTVHREAQRQWAHDMQLLLSIQEAKEQDAMRRAAEKAD